MCGRVYFIHPAQAVAEFSDVALPPWWEFRYNVPPGTKIPAVRQAQSGERELVELMWGFIPSWHKRDEPVTRKPINARKESLRSGLWRGSFARKRCLIPVSGFYEGWKPDKKKKSERWFRFSDYRGRPLALGGLWDQWIDANGELFETCAIITTESIAEVRAVHDRMPVILDPKQFEDWLAPAPLENPHLYVDSPSPALHLECVEVHPTVMNARAMQGSDCLDEYPPLSERELKARADGWKYTYYLKQGIDGPAKMWKKPGGQPTSIEEYEESGG